MSQFGSLNTLQLEYDTTQVQFLGVNREDGADDAAEAVEGVSIPLLQDTTDVDAWGLWEVEWRDLVLLDADNQVVGVINLTEHDLAEEENVELVRELVDEALAR